MIYKLQRILLPQQQDPLMWLTNQMSVNTLILLIKDANLPLKHVVASDNQCISTVDVDLISFNETFETHTQMPSSNVMIKTLNHMRGK